MVGTGSPQKTYVLSYVQPVLTNGVVTGTPSDNGAAAHLVTRKHPSLSNTLSLPLSLPLENLVTELLHSACPVAILLGMPSDSKGREREGAVDRDAIG